MSDFLQQTTAQLRALMASMTPGARITAGLLLAVVVVSVAFLFQQATTGPDEYLFGGEPLPASRIARMEAAMAQAGVTGYAVDGLKIKVPRSQREAAIAAIAAAGELPPDVYKLMDEAVDGGSLFDFRDTREQRVRAKREQQAALILSSYPWVSQATVTYTSSEGSGLTGKRRATAAVSLMPEVGEAITSKRLREVRRFVAMHGDVPESQIAITNLAGGDGLAAGDAVDPEEFDHPLYRLKALTERELKRKITQLLSYIDGVRVEVNAKLDDTERSVRVQVKPEQEGVQIRNSRMEERDTQTSGPAGSRVGVEANGPGPQARDEALTTVDQIEKTRESSDTANVVGSSKTETVTMGMAVKEAEASVAVPLSYVLSVYRKENRGPDGQEPEEVDPTDLQIVQDRIVVQIENLVRGQMPKLALGQDEFRQVHVEVIPDQPKQLPEPPSLASNALAWTGRNSNLLAMSGLTIFALMMLRSLVKASPSGEPTPGLPSLQLDGEALEGEDEEEPDRPRLKLRKADSLKDDLTDMVSSDPDAAAAILKNWINNAG